MFFRNLQRKLARLYSFMRNDVSAIPLVSRLLTISDLERLVLGGLELGAEDESKDKAFAVNTFSIRLKKSEESWKLFRYRPDLDFVEFDGFAISKSVVTQELYQEVMRGVKIPQALKGVYDKSFSGEPLVIGYEGTLLGFSGPKYPVYNVSVLHAMLFCNELNKICGQTEPYSFEVVDGYNTEDGDSFEFVRFFRRLDVDAIRLPTLDEWQYAAACDMQKSKQAENIWSGTTDPGMLRNYAWTVSNSDLELHEVCQKQPNACGLYDMSGNVYEWTEHFETNYNVSYLDQSFEEKLDELNPGHLIEDAEGLKMFLGVGHFYNSTFCWVVGGDIFSYAKECVANDVCDLAKVMNPLTIYKPCVEGSGFEYMDQVRTLWVDRDFDGFDRSAQEIPVFVGFRIVCSSEKGKEIK